MESYTLASETGGSLAVTEAGSPSAPLIILMHGGGQTRHSWRRTSATLAEADYHAVAYDARGHGDSDWASDGDYSFKAHARDLRAILQNFDRLPVLVGASMGGLTSLIALGQDMVRAKALVLVDVVPTLINPGAARIRAFMSRHHRGFATIDDAVEAVDDYREAGTRGPRSRSIARSLRQHDDGRYYWHWDPRILWDETKLRDGFVEAELAAAARALTLPVLLIRGGASDVVTDDGVAAFRTLVPHAEVVEIPSAGHMIVGDDNDMVNDALLRFLGTLDQRA